MLELRSRLDRRVLRVSLVTSILVELFVPAEASAFRTIRDELDVEESLPVEWSASPIHVDASGARLSAASVVAAVTRSHTPWAATACAVPDVVWADADAMVSSLEDGRSSLAFVRDEWESLGLPRDAVGVTDLVMNVGADALAIVEVDIRLDARRTWVSVPGVDGSVFLETVVAHELGHALGLAHPCEGNECGLEHVGRLMHPLYDAAIRGELSLDDIDGICSLYGERACETAECEPPEMLFGSSQVGDACFESEACESGVCNDAHCLPRECAVGDCDAASLDALGEACNEGESCLSSMCLLDREGGYCTRSCAEHACPSGFECASVDDTRVCRSFAATSCAAAGATRSDATFVWMCMGLLVVWRRSWLRVKR